MVVSGEGAPIAGARVCATCVSCDATRTDLQVCTDSDVQGRFALGALQAIGYRVVAAAPGFAPGTANEGRPLRVGGEQSASPLQIVLQRGGVEVTGSVLDAFGGPVAGAQVRVVQWQTVATALEVSSGEDGRFSAWIAPGATTLLASASGYAPVTQYRVAPASSVELVLTPASSLSGTVISAEDGSPVADAELHAYRVDRPPLASQKTTRSGADGQFSIDALEQAEYVVEAVGQNYRGSSQGSVTVGVGARVADVVVRVSRAVQVRGRVSVGSTRTECEAGMVSLGPPERSPFSRPSFSDEVKAAIRALDQPGRPRPLTLTAPIGAGGSVQFDGVPAGQYFATVQCVGYQLREGPELVAVGLQDIAGLEWRVEHGLALAVEVVDENRRPVPRAPFMLAFPSSEAGAARPVMALTADAAGRYETSRSLYPGRYRVEPSGNAAGERVEVTLAEGADSTTATLRLRGTATLLIKVESSDGRAVDGAEVEAVLEPSGGAESAAAQRLVATPRGAGEYVLAPLQAGSYRVEVSDGINPGVAAERGAPLRVLAGQVTKTTVVLAQTAEIRGRVLDEQGNPVENAWVSAEREGDDLHTRYVVAMKRAEGAGRTLSDPEGKFVVPRLSPGATFTVRVDQPGGGLELVRGVRAGSVLDLVLRARARVRGVVADAQGAVPALFVVSAVQRESGETRQRQFSRNDGQFELDGIMPGTVELTAADPRHNIGQLQMDLHAGQTLEGLRVILQPSAAAAASEQRAD